MFNNKNLTLQATEEQKQIIKAVADGKNIIVNAVAGSGKTTTALMGIQQLIADTSGKCSVLFLTYSKSLCDDIQKKTLDMFDIRHQSCCVVATLHSFAGKFFDYSGQVIKDNNSFIQATNDSMYSFKVRYGTFNFDLIVVDEAQDLLEIYLPFLSLISRVACKKDHSWLILGDKKQNLFAFQGADARFLTLFPDIMNNKQFIKLNLTRSFRLTKSMVNFVNERILKGEYVKTEKGFDVPVKVYMMKELESFDFITKYICQKLSDQNRPEQIMIMGYSRHKTLENLNNHLLEVENPISVFFPAKNLDRATNSEERRGKVEFSTVHQSKGREADFVIIYRDLGMENSWEEKPGTDNLNYVAHTRAKKELLLFFIGQQKLKNNTTINLPSYFPPEGLPKKDKEGLSLIMQGGSDKTHFQLVETSKHTTFPKGVTDLLEWLKHDAKILLQKKVEKVLVGTIPTSGHNPFPVTVPGKEGRYGPTKEYVADVTSIYFSLSHASLTSKEGSKCYCGDAKTNLSLSKIMGSVADEQTLRIVHQEHVKDSFKNSYYQVKHWQWLSGSEMQVEKQMLFDRLKKLISSDFKEYWFEIRMTMDTDSLMKHLPGLGIDISNLYLKNGLTGILDLITFNNKNDFTIYEFKCVGYLKLEHVLQCCVYLWMINKGAGDEHGLSSAKEIILFNQTNGQKLIIKNDPKAIEEIVTELFLDYITNLPVLDDQEFLSSVKKAIDSVYSFRRARNILDLDNSPNKV